MEIESTYEYDARGNVVTEIDALGKVTKRRYDDDNRELSVTIISDRSGANGFTTTYTYDAQGNKLTETDALGNTTYYTYNSKGQMLTMTNALGNGTAYTYDVRGNLTSKQDALNNITRYGYDARGNLLSIIEPNNRVSKFENDDSDNQRIINRYNQLGELVSTISNLGVTTNYQYDALGRMTTVSNLYKGHSVDTSTAYDAIGRKISVTDALGHTTKYFYDALDRLVETKYADGISELVTYDAFGNTLTKTDRLGRVTRYEYDSLNQMIATIDALGHRTEYQYNELGNLVYQKDTNNNITRYEYDTLGHQTAVIRPMGQRQEFAYDSVGRLTSITDFNGQVTNLEYDSYDHIKRKSFVQTGKTVDFKFSASGKIEQVTDENGTTTYNYNLDERLTSVINPDGKRIDYTYDSTGQLIAVTTPSGTVSYRYDELARLSKVVSSEGITEYTYDDLGNLISTKLPNGIIESRTYDDLNRLTSVINRDSSGNHISGYNYVLDALGDKTRVTEINGRQVEYSYDELRRLTSEKVTDSLNGTRTIDYVYDAVGNRMSRNDSVGGLTTYVYDNNDRLTIESHQGVDTIYTYDHNGNIINAQSSAQQISYGWNQENRLTSIDTQTPNGVQNVEYRYDFNGNRIATITDGRETRYLVDINRYYAQVLEEYQPEGQTQTSYVYGLDLISEHGNSSVFYLKDGYSGTRQLTDSVGQVTDAYTYDAYGRLLSSTGNTENNYGYQGQQTDGSSGLQYLRARYYDPNLGRFASVDPREGSLDAPVSRHRYLYANNNPLSFFDPSGESAVANTLAVSLLDILIGAVSNVVLRTAVLDIAVGTAAALTAAAGVYAYWVNRGGGEFMVWKF